MNYEEEIKELTKRLNTVETILAQVSDALIKFLEENQQEAMATENVSVVTSQPINVHSRQPVISGKRLETGDRVLVRHQPTAVENGVYTVNDDKSLTKVE